MDTASGGDENPENGGKGAERVPGSDGKGPKSKETFQGG